LTANELAVTLREAIERGIANHPRSQQRELGPSEVGHQCLRRLAYRLLGTPVLNQSDGLARDIGTGYHARLAAHLLASNAIDDRFIAELDVEIPHRDGVIRGTCDAYDASTRTVVDWKVVGTTPLRHYRTHGPGEQYRVQVHLYGVGVRHLGLPVEHVAVAFIPRCSGQLTDLHLWCEPFDEQVADDALRRLDALECAVAALGAAVLPALPTAPAFCHRCPWFVRDSVDAEGGCPGDPASLEPRPSAPALTFS
jgi:hypothetical protein